PMQNAYQSAFGTGSYKMFVTKINATGSALIFSTYLGGSGEEDIGTGIATDTAGAVYVTGCTGSSNFPVTPGAFQTAFGGGNIMNGIWQASDAFVTKFNSSGTLVYSTFLGGSGDENEYYDTFNGDVALAIHGWGKIAVNRAGEAHLVGHTQSPNFPLTAGAFQTTGTSGGTYNNYDFFFTVLNAAGSNLVYSTYVGGSTIAPGGNSAREYVGNIALIENTCAGATTVIGAGTSHSDGFPTTAGVFQPAKLNSYADQPVIFRFSLGAGTFLTASVTATPATCGNSDGSATVTASGGTPGYTYSWIPSGGSSSTATGLSAGNYTCIVTDGNGCSQAQIITINNSNGPTVTTATTPQTCVQGGTATANASGGTLPYTYQWCNGQTTSAASNLSAGTCTVTVTDAGGCSVTSTVTITSSVSTPSTAVTSTPAACGNNNGTSTVTASGGNGSYTYGWSTSPVQTTATATGLAGGTYTITVTDANGCTKTATVSITQTGGPTVTTSTTPQTCTAGGTATANPSGGTSPYTYQWCNGQTGSTASNLSAGSCTVTVIDAGGCSTTSTVVITSSGSIPTATVTSTPASCGNNNGTATANVSGGTSPYTYSWNPTGQTSSAATGLAAGVYTVTVTDAIGCSAIQTISVTSNSTLNATITSTQTGCTVNNGTATASVSGGTSPYTYLWNPSGQTASTATGLGAGNYSVTMTDANGCTQTQTAVITSVPGPAAAVSAASTNITIGNNTSLTATGGGTYSWSPAAGLSCATCANPVATPSQTTTYCVVVTDGNGCTDNACLTINIDIPCGDIFVPNAFSPNNDGENELECVLGSCIETLKFSIFDRWGEKVFETTDPKICWDGTYKGKLLNTAAFVYYLKGVLTSGEKINRKGNISLIR
ncbi:MAG: T9SS type B sorting domain-containing protein, partial [Bacteroidetes bacterium]